MKKITFILIICLFLSCANNDDDNSSSSTKNRLFAVESILDDNNRLKSTDIIEIDINNGEYISTIKSMPLLQAHLDYDFGYLNSTNELLIRQSVYEGNRGEELIKVNIDNKNETTLNCESFSHMVTDETGRLFAFKRIFDNQLLSIDLVEINSNDGSIISTLESFKALDNAPDNDKTGVNYFFYSKDTKELIIPRRTSFYSDSIDDLIKININTRNKTIVKTINYETITIGNNGQLFALKNIIDNGKYNSELVEIDINSGNEKQSIAIIDNVFRLDSNIYFLENTNEVIFYSIWLYKINVKTKQISKLSLKNYSAICNINLN